MKNSLFMIVAFLISIFTFSGNLFGQIETARKRWEDLATKSSGIHCRVRVDYGSPNIKGDSFEFFIAQDKICQILRHADGSQRVACRNSVYAFELTRSSEKTAWALVGLFPLSEASSRTAALKGIAIPQVSVVPQDLDWTVRQDKFELRSSAGDDNIRFSCDTPYYDRRARTDVTLKLDEERNFSADEWNGTMVAEMGKGTVRGKMTYSNESLDNWPIPLMCELNITPESESVVTWKYLYDTWEFVPITSDQFQLSGFGLEEPDFDSGRGRWNYYVLSGAILVLALGVLVLRGRLS